MCFRTKQHNHTTFRRKKITCQQNVAEGPYFKHRFILRILNQLTFFKWNTSTYIHTLYMYTDTSFFRSLIPLNDLVVNALARIYWSNYCHNTKKRYVYNSFHRVCIKSDEHWLIEAFVYKKN